MATEESLVFEMEVNKKHLNSLITENTNQELIELRTENKRLSAELAKLRTPTLQPQISLDNQLASLRQAYDQLRREKTAIEQEKFELEQRVSALDKKLRLDALKQNNIELESVESKLLKLKLSAVENEKRFLIDDIAKERKLLENRNRPRMERLENNVKLIRKWVEREKNERFPRVSADVKQLREQIAVLEQDKLNLIEGFELERKVFRKIFQKYNLNNN